MLHSKTNLVAPELSPIAIDEPSPAELLAQALGVVRRQIAIVLVFLLLGLVLGGVFLINAPPKYTATATLLVDTHKIDLLQQPAVSAEMPIQSTGAMESQVELLRSDEVALWVIKKLNLSNDTRFIGEGGPSFFGSLLQKILPLYFRESLPMSEAERQDIALKIFNVSLTADRVGITYAIEIQFVSRFPDLAAAVANAVGDAYIDLQRTSEYDAARRASDWLEKRIPELRAQSEAAQRAVVEYQHEHNIVETSSGQLVNDQRLEDLNDKLTAAHDDTLKAKAWLDEFATISDPIVPGEIDNLPVSDGTKSGLLDTLRRQYLDTSSQEAESLAKLGPNNPVIISLRNKKTQLRSEISVEIKRLKNSSKSEYEAAQLRELTLKKEFDAAMIQSQTAKQAQVQLRELESSARAHQDMYNTFLSRYNASLQQAISPVAEASIITPATPLIKKDHKKTYQVAALFPIGALVLGLGVALLRELFSGRVFLTSKSVQSHLRFPCIGLLPKIEKGKRRRRWRPKEPPSPIAPRTLVRGDYEISWTAVDYPLTRFSEGLRSIMLAIDSETKSTSNRVFGLTSATPNEGKSTVTLAIGQLFARNGASVIVVDCDLRNPSLTRSLAPNAASGIIELAYGRASLENVVWKDPSTQMAFLPAIPHAGPPDPPTILSSTEMKQLFNELRKQYDFVFVDLSPIAPVVDVCATTELIDAYVLVIEWGRTTVDVVQHALRSAPIPFETMLGAVLNKADIKILAAYDPYLTGYYYQNDRR